MLLNQIPRATGHEFWEFKVWQSSVAPFLCLKHHCSTADSCGTIPLLCPCLLCWLSHCLHCLPAGEPSLTLCSSRPMEDPATNNSLPYLGQAGGLHLWLFGLFSLLASSCIPSCSPLNASMHRSVSCASILSRGFFVDILWIIVDKLVEVSGQ